MKFYINNKLQNIEINRLIVAGWTGRDEKAVQHHIDELAELGIAPPSTVPLFYQVTNSLLSQEDTIQVLSKGTSGEVEPLIVKENNKLWIGLASDHTDRELEAFSVAHSKQICVKPTADILWDFDEVKNHLEKIELKSWLDEGEGWVLYQEGALTSIRPLTELIEKGQMTENSAMLCGTLGAIGGVRETPKFKLSMIDPILNRTIEFAYAVKNLTVVK